MKVSCDLGNDDDDDDDDDTVGIHAGAARCSAYGEEHGQGRGNAGC